MINIIKYICLSLILLNASTIVLEAFGTSMGSIFSILTFLMPIIYAIVTKRITLLKIFLVIGISYFLISGLQFYRGDEKYFIRDFIRFVFLVIFGGEIVRNTSKNELFVFLFIGASSIIINAIFFADNYGRYSGIYLDPNVAGFICISGFGLTYGLNKSKLKVIGQFIFTFAGFLTFSRTFIVLWILLNLISLKLNPKNIKLFLIGTSVIILLISFGSVLKLNTIRLNQLKALVTNEKVSAQELNDDSRTDTWASFYEYVMDKPFLGNGYGSFQTNGFNSVGPHNTYLLVIGESGILVFLIFVGFHIYLLYSSANIFVNKPNLLMMSIGVSIFLLTNHNYFSIYYLILISMWITLQIKPILNEN